MTASLVSAPTPDMLARLNADKARKDRLVARKPHDILLTKIEYNEKGEPINASTVTVGQTFHNGIRFK